MVQGGGESRQGECREYMISTSNALHIQPVTRFDRRSSRRTRPVGGWCFSSTARTRGTRCSSSNSPRSRPSPSTQSSSPRATQSGRVPFPNLHPASCWASPPPQPHHAELARDFGRRLAEYPSALHTLPRNSLAASHKLSVRALLPDVHPRMSLDSIVLWLALHCRLSIRGAGVGGGCELLK